MMRTIVEDLNYAASEPSSQAAQQAKQMGLVYVGFGRYEDPTTKQITHIVQNERLVPFRKAIKSTSYRASGSNDIGNFVSALAPEVQQISDTLTQAYGPENFDEKELNAIQDFVTQSYDNVNSTLARLPAGITANKIEPQSMNDTVPDTVAGLDSAMKKVRVPVDFIVYTALDSGFDRKNLIPGSQFKIKSYKSTSLNLAAVVSAEESSLNILQIRVKRNSKGLYAADYSPTPEEGEFILPRGARVEVISGPTRLVGSDEQSSINKEIYYYDCSLKT